jgi:cytochrome c oxidase assembly protein subunit 17
MSFLFGSRTQQPSIGMLKVTISFIYSFSSQTSSLHNPLTPPPETAQPMGTTNNLASDLKPAGDASAKVKPCCVCKDEKAARDECMLFSSSDDPAKECVSLVTEYKSCMKGFGFSL